MKLRQSNLIILVSYACVALTVVFVGGYLDSSFIILLGLYISIIGLVFSNKNTQNQIIYNLKKNNLWDDEIPKKTNDPDLKVIQEEMKKRGVDSKEEYDKMMKGIEGKKDGQI